MNTGIYLIEISEYKYVGSAINIKVRWSNHLGRLSRNIHENSFMQNVFNKLGKDKLTFSVLEYCEKELLIEREQYYIDTYFDMFDNKMMNICKVAGSKLGLKHSDETRKRMSEANIGKKLSDETRKRMSEARTGSKHSDETKKKMSEASRKLKYDSIALISPDGIIHHNIQNVTDFCKLHGLNNGSVSSMINKKKSYNQASGWQVYSITIDCVEHFKELKAFSLQKPREPNRVVSFISPSGVLFEGIRNVTAFCKEHSLHNGNVNAIILGKRKSAQGWRIRSITFEEAS
jgi:group I intron endonuclease